MGEKQVPGVIGLKAYHLTTAEEAKTVPKLREFYIDIGAGIGKRQVPWWPLVMWWYLIPRAWSLATGFSRPKPLMTALAAPLWWSF